MRAIGRLLPDAGPARVLSIAQLTDSIGLGGYLVCSALYFTRIVGLSPAQVGIGLTAGWAAGFLAGVPLGHLADRRGPRGIAILLAASTAATLVAFLFVRSFEAFLVVACLYCAGQCGLTAARQALLAGLVAPAARTRVRAVLQAAINGGIAIGATARRARAAGRHRGGVPDRLRGGRGQPADLRAASCCDSRPSRPAPAAAAGEPALAVLRDRPYAVLAVLNMVLQLHIPLITLGLPLWIVQRTHAPGWTVAALLVLNTMSIVLFQVRVARRVRDLATAARQVRAAGVVLLVACVVFALSAAGDSALVAVAILLLAAALQALAEMMQASGSWEISFTLAPAGKHGQYQGFFGSGFTVARMLGPVLVTTLIISWGTAGWLLLGGVFVAAGVAIVPAVRAAPHENSFA